MPFFFFLTFWTIYVCNDIAAASASTSTTGIGGVQHAIIPLRSSTPYSNRTSHTKAESARNNNHQSSATLKSSQTETPPIIVWEELQPSTEPNTSTTNEDAVRTIFQRQRKSLWDTTKNHWNRWFHQETIQYRSSCSNNNNYNTERDHPSLVSTTTTTMSADPHPLRMALWEIPIVWKGLARPPQQKRAKCCTSPIYNSSRFILEFDVCGYVRIRPKCTIRKGVTTTITATTTHPSLGTDPRSDDDEEDEDPIMKPIDKQCIDWITVGKWKQLTSTRISFTIPFPMFNSTTTKENMDSWYSIHHFEADLHTNPFRPYPKMTRGVIVRHDPDNNCSKNTKQWFRPVVGTFSGIGIGQDTMDLSYKGRKPPQQV